MIFDSSAVMANWVSAVERIKNVQLNRTGYTGKNISVYPRQENGIPLLMSNGIPFDMVYHMWYTPYGILYGIETAISYGIPFCWFGQTLDHFSQNQRLLPKINKQIYKTFYTFFLRNIYWIRVSEKKQSSIFSTQLHNSISRKNNLHLLTNSFFAKSVIDRDSVNY